MIFLCSKYKQTCSSSRNGCRNNNSINEIWKHFITMEIVNLILHFTNLKINAFLDALDQERKPYYARQIEETEIASIFWVFICSRFISS